MSGHFHYPRRSNVELGHRWDAFPDAPSLAEHAAAAAPTPPLPPAAAAAGGAGTDEARLSAAQIEEQIRALQSELARRRRRQRAL